MAAYWDPRYLAYSPEEQRKVDALVSAGRSGDTTEIMHLLDQGVDVNVVNQYGRSALMEASWKGRIPAVKLLLQQGASVNSTDRDGESALFYASVWAKIPVMKWLLQHGAHVNSTDKHGDTALHRACWQYNPSDQNRINAITVLIEGGADPHLKNKFGKTPLDLLGTSGGRSYIDINTNEAKPIKRALERREYSTLLSQGSVPLRVAKLFLLGDPAAGKTTLKKSLLKKPPNFLEKLFRKSGASKEPHIPTPGIDVGRYNVHGVGEISIWDAAGHAEFHVTHGMFLGHQNAMAVIMYNLKEGRKEAEARLRKWLKFLNSGQHPTAKTKLKIIVVGSHLDEFEESEKAMAKKEASLILNTIKGEFGEEMEISDAVLVVDAQDAHSEEMKLVREILKDTRDKITGTIRIPKLCGEILDKKNMWYTSKSPVLPYNDYKEKVKEIDPLVSDDTLRISSSYLQDMGEIFIAESKEATYIVLDTQWLAYHIIGPTFAGDDFKRFKKLPNQPYYTRKELEIFYDKVADFQVLVALLESLELMAPCSEDEYIIPAKLQEEEEEEEQEEENKKVALSNGGCIVCVGRTMFAPILFSAIQVRIVKDLRSKGKQSRVTLRSIRWSDQIHSLVSWVDDKDAINFAVSGVVDNADACHKSLENIKQMLTLAINELSPGTRVATGYLSPMMLNKTSKLKSLTHYYTIEEIEKAEEDGTGEVSNQIMKVSEKTTDILIAGFDPYFIRKRGMKCNYRWLLQNKKQKEKIFTFIDDTRSCLRTDYRSLVEVLGIDGVILQAIEKKCEGSCTDAVIRHWCETTGKEMTFGMLLTMFKHPGLVGNSKAADIIEEMLKERVPKEQLQLHDTDGGLLHIKPHLELPDALILWRAVLRKTHNELQKWIKPTKTTGLLVESNIISARDESDIRIKEKDERRPEAVDILISKLLQLQTPDWPEMFLKSLEPNYPDLASELQRVSDELEEDIFASVTLNIDEHTSDSTTQEKTKCTDLDFRDLIEKLGLDDLKDLYTALELKDTDVEKCEASANSNKVARRAMKVLVFWRKNKDKGATKEALLEALKKCRHVRTREELEEKWKTQEKATCTETDFMDLISLLGMNELKRLYLDLGLENIDVEKEEASANTNNVSLKAKRVLIFWRKTQGQAATREVILAALTKCRHTEASTALAKKWKMQEPPLPEPGPPPLKPGPPLPEPSSPQHKPPQSPPHQQPEPPLPSSTPLANPEEQLLEPPPEIDETPSKIPPSKPGSLKTLLIAASVAFVFLAVLIHWYLKN